MLWLVEHSNSREKTQLCLIFCLHFSCVLLCHSVLYYCLETQVMLFYSLMSYQIFKQAWYCRHCSTYHALSFIISSLFFLSFHPHGLFSYLKELLLIKLIEKMMIVHPTHTLITRNLLRGRVKISFAFIKGRLFL